MATTWGIADAVTVRMHRHALWSPLDAGAGAVVERLVAMQAQEYAYALWSTAQRRVDGAPGNTAADLTAAVDRGEVLRTHVLRPTWHFVAPADVRWLLALTAPHIHRGNDMYYRKTGLDAETLTRVHHLLTAELSQGVHRTRAQLQATLAAGGIVTSGLRLTYAMMHAELEQVVISGASLGRQRSYALFDDRVPPSVARSDAVRPGVGAPVVRDRATGLLLLAERYLSTRGPASVKDFAVWSGLPMADARNGVESAIDDSAGRFEPVDVEGITLWWEPCPAVPPTPTPPRVDLVQGYDEYVMSYFESKHLLFTPAAWRREPAATFYHSVLLDGLLAASWKHVITSTSAVVQVAPLRVLTAREMTAVEAAVVEYGHFLGVPASTIWWLPPS